MVSLLCLPWSLEERPWLRLVTSPPRVWVVKKICWKGGVTGFLIVTVTNLLRQGESGMSLDSVVFALKSCFKTKQQKSFTLLTQVYVGFVQLYVTEITVITCSVKGTAVFSPRPKRCTESHFLVDLFHTWSVGHAQGD